MLENIKLLSISDLMLVTLIVVCLTWYIQWHWNRRHLYKLVWKIPGPTPLPLLGNALLLAGPTKYIYKNAMKLFNDYPGLFKAWIGYRLYFGIQTPEEVEIILTSPKALAKDNIYYYFEIIGGQGLFTAKVSTWKRHRKAIAPTFNQKILDSFVEVFAEQSTILVNVLRKFAGKGEFDIFHVISNCTIDTICETAMGEKVNTQNSESRIGLWIDRVFEIIFLRGCVIFYQFDVIFNRLPISKILYQLIKKLQQFCGKIIKTKMNTYKKEINKRKSYTEDYYFYEGEKRKVFLDYLLELSDQGEDFSEKELLDEVLTFVMAGSDTTATTNSFVLLCLGMYEEIQNKVYREIMEVIGPDGDVTAEDIPKLKYIQRVIRETLRVFPVAAFIVRTAEEDLSLPTCTVPAKSSLVVGIHAIHKNPNYWPHPNKFDPDRFLPEEVVKRHPYSYLPFSGGPRNCIGYRYGMMAMKTLIATVIRKYKIITEYKSIEDVELKMNLVLKPVNGFKISLELRN